MDSQDAVNRVGRGVSEMTFMKSGVKMTRRGTVTPVAPVLGLLRRLVPHDPVDRDERIVKI